MKSLLSVLIVLLISNICFSQNDKIVDAYSKKKNGTLIIPGPSYYTTISAKSWDQILAERMFQWRPPYTVHLPIQPVNSPDFIHVDCALNVCRRRVAPNIDLNDRESYAAARSQETFIVQFAFDDPPFIPDFNLSTLSLADNSYPIVKGDYYARDLYYQIEYICCPVSEIQSMLWIRLSVTNTGTKTQQAHIRAKVNFQREIDLFDNHYIPFFWDIRKWLPCDKVRLDKNHIIKENQIIGKIDSESMKVNWESEMHFQDNDFNKKFGISILPDMRLNDVKDVIHARAELEPNEEKTFSLALLTNNENITKSDLLFLEKASAVDSRERALSHFKNQFTKENTVMVFPTGQWQDIFTQLQLSTLQLLVKYPGKENLMPTQGGSTERFFVWVWEAAQMLEPMLRTGHFLPVKRSLDYIFSLQDAGCPPEGKFTTTEGSIGTTGPKWINTTGSALALACDYYIYSNDKDFLDQYLPKILKACRWIAGELRATRKLDPDGTRPLYYGLMPFGCATDGDVGYVVPMTDGYTFRGLEKTVRLLEQINHSEAVELREELELYRVDIAVAVNGLSRPDGYIDRKISTNDAQQRVFTKASNTSSSARLAFTGVINPESDIFTRFINYFENNMAVGYFMGNMDQEITYIGVAEHEWQHIYLSLGQWKKAFAVTRTNLQYGMSQDTYQTQERFSRRNPAFTPWQPNGSGNGRMINMMLNSIYFENDQSATLLGCVPFSWLVANRVTSLKNLYTRNGRINIEVTAIDNNSCQVSLFAVDRNALPATIRFPEDFHAKTKSSSVVNKGHGFFIIKGHPENLEFTIFKN